MKRFLMLATVILGCAFGTGCASIVSGTNQSVSVKARQSSGENVPAECSLVNDKGTWYTQAPGSVTVRRSYNDLTVNCQAKDHPIGIATAKSATKGMAFGNILFGGIIGAGVDMSTGAAYDYPEVIDVTMGSIGNSPLMMNELDAKSKEASPTMKAEMPGTAQLKRVGYEAPRGGIAGQ